MDPEADQPAEAEPLPKLPALATPLPVSVIPGGWASPVELAHAPAQVASDAQAAELWLRQYAGETQRAYGRDLAAFLAHVRKPLREVTALDAQDYAAWLAEPVAEDKPRCSLASQARRIASLKSATSFLHEVGYLPFDVGKPVRIPKQKDTLAERILDEAQIERMIEGEPSPRNHTLLRLAYWCGLRVSELCGLRWRDLKAVGKNGGGQATVFGKGEKTRVVVLIPKLWRQLAPLKRDAGADDPVFRSREGGALDPSQVGRIVKAAARRAGLPESVSTHWLRHGHASHALAKGAPLPVLQRSMGHSDPRTTMRYVHVQPGEGSATYFDK